MLTSRTGDATQPGSNGPSVLVHICIDQGHWGAGFVLALSRRFKAPEAAYRAWSIGKGDSQDPFELEERQAVGSIVGSDARGACRCRARRAREAASRPGKGHTTAGHRKTVTPDDAVNRAATMPPGSPRM